MAPFQSGVVEAPAAGPAPPMPLSSSSATTTKTVASAPGQAEAEAAMNTPGAFTFQAPTLAPSATSKRSRRSISKNAKAAKRARKTKARPDDAAGVSQKGVDTADRKTRPIDSTVANPTAALASASGTTVSYQPRHRRKSPTSPSRLSSASSVDAAAAASLLSSQQDEKARIESPSPTRYATPRQHGSLSPPAQPLEQQQQQQSASTKEESRSAGAKAPSVASSKRIAQGMTLQHVQSIVKERQRETEHAHRRLEAEKPSATKSSDEPIEIIDSLRNVPPASTSSKDAAKPIGKAKETPSAPQDRASKMKAFFRENDDSEEEEEEEDEDETHEEESPTWKKQKREESETLASSVTLSTPTTATKKKSNPKGKEKAVKTKNRKDKERKQRSGIRATLQDVLASTKALDAAPAKPKVGDDFIGFEMDSEEEKDTEDDNTITYEGKKIRDDFNPLVMPRPPWVPEGRQYSTPLIQMLHEEILDFVAYLSPTPTEHALRCRLFDRLKAVTLSVFPSAEIRLFGSFETGLYLPTSDIDIVILIPEVPSIQNLLPQTLEYLEARSATIEALHKISEALIRNGVVAKQSASAQFAAMVGKRPRDREPKRGVWALQNIDNAKIPIIKMADAVSDFTVDITLNMSNGLHGANLIKDLCRMYDPWCRTLVLLIKEFLVERSINEVFTGGLGSYAITCMVTFFLRVHPLVNHAHVGPQQNLGILFIEFLQLFGNALHHQDVGISLGAGYKEKRIFKKRAKTVNGELLGPARFFAKRHHPHLLYTDRDRANLSIEDPADPTNDIGKQTYRYDAVRKAFDTASTLLGACLVEWEAKRSEGLVHGKDIMPETLLGVILRLSDDVKAHRARLAAKYDAEVAAGRLFSMGAAAPRPTKDEPLLTVPETSPTLVTTAAEIPPSSNIEQKKGAPPTEKKETHDDDAESEEAEDGRPPKRHKKRETEEIAKLKADVKAEHVLKSKLRKQERRRLKREAGRPERPKTKTKAARLKKSEEKDKVVGKEGGAQVQTGAETEEFVALSSSSSSSSRSPTSSRS